MSILNNIEIKYKIGDFYYHNSQPLAAICWELISWIEQQPIDVNFKDQWEKDRAWFIKNQIIPSTIEFSAVWYHDTLAVQWFTTESNGYTRWRHILARATFTRRL